jgi:hypothetical protein
MDVLAAIFEDLAGKGIVFLNSLRAFTPGLEENSSDFAAPLLALAGLSRKFGVPVWINHHTNKSGGVRGTSAIAAAAGNSWTLTVEEGMRIMSHTANRMCKARKPFQVVQEPSALVMRAVEARDMRDAQKGIRENLKAIEGAREKIQQALFSQKRWVPRTELVRDLGVKNDVAVEALRQLRHAIPAVVGYKKEAKSDYYHHDPKMTPKA